MIEWTASPLPKNGDKRIEKRFCIWPHRCQQNKVVWLGFVYLFQYYDESYATMDMWRHEKWTTEATLSPSQYEAFVDSLALNLTDSREKIREYAELVKKVKK